MDNLNLFNKISDEINDLEIELKAKNEILKKL